VERPVAVEGLEEDAAIELARTVRETVLGNYQAQSATA